MDALDERRRLVRDPRRLRGARLLRRTQVFILGRDDHRERGPPERCREYAGQPADAGPGGPVHVVDLLPPLRPAGFGGIDLGQRQLRIPAGGGSARRRRAQGHQANRDLNRQLDGFAMPIALQVLGPAWKSAPTRPRLFVQGGYIFQFQDRVLQRAGSRSPTSTAPRAARGSGMELMAEPQGAWWASAGVAFQLPFDSYRRG